MARKNTKPPEAAKGMAKLERMVKKVLGQTPVEGIEYTKKGRDTNKLPS